MMERDGSASYHPLQLVCPALPVAQAEFRNRSLELAGE
jgi:hypothetical protein